MPDLWVQPESLSGTLASEPDAYEACQTASFILWGLSGRKFNKARTVTERYECACKSTDSTLLRFNVIPVLEGGEVYNRAGNSCGCDEKHSRLRLRNTPVRSIHSVQRDGEVFAPGSYRVYNSGILEVDTSSIDGACGLEVRYTYGTGIPAAGRAAARKLAEEFLRGWTGDDDCALPSRTTSVSREGVSLTILDKQDFLEDLRTGVYEVDLFLKTVNPGRALKRARVFSPDVPKAFRTTSGDGAATSSITPPTLYGGTF